MQFSGSAFSTGPLASPGHSQKIPRASLVFIEEIMGGDDSSRAVLHSSQVLEENMGGSDKDPEKAFFRSLDLGLEHIRTSEDIRARFELGLLTEDVKQFLEQNIGSLHSIQDIPEAILGLSDEAKDQFRRLYALELLVRLDEETDALTEASERLADLILASGFFSETLFSVVYVSDRLGLSEQEIIALFRFVFSPEDILGISEKFGERFDLSIGILNNMEYIDSHILNIYTRLVPPSGDILVLSNTEASAGIYLDLFEAVSDMVDDHWVRSDSFRGILGRIGVREAISPRSDSTETMVERIGIWEESRYPGVCGILEAYIRIRGALDAKINYYDPKRPRPRLRRPGPCSNRR